MSHNSPYPEALERVIATFSHLPGIGKRTAERLVLAMLKWEKQDVAQFGDELLHLLEHIAYCPLCGNFTEPGAPCPICSDETRQQDIICVVEQVPQIAIIEKSRCYHGLYHVLGGKLSPLNGIGPNELRIASLKQRLASGNIKELFLAISPDVEGEATANYLAEELSSPALVISRIASGIPIGADLAITDSATLSTAITGRRRITP